MIKALYLFLLKAVYYLLVSIVFPRTSIKISQIARQESIPSVAIQIITLFFPLLAQKIHSC